MRRFSRDILSSPEMGGEKRCYTLPGSLRQRFVTLLAACLQFVPLVRVLFCPLKDRVDNPAPRLGIPPVIYQDAINHHFDLFFRMLIVFCHSEPS